MNSSEIIPSLEQSLITSDRDCIQLGSEEVATILVNLKSEEGEIIEEGGADVLIYAEGIEISETEDNKDGSYRAFISGAREISEARVGFRLEGKPSTKLITIRVQERCPEPFIDFERTQLIAEPPEILNDGKDYSTLLLQLYDREGRLLDDKTPVSLMANSGILSSTVFDAEQRLFTAFFRSRRVGEVGVYVSVRNVRYPVNIGEVRVVDPEPPEEEFSVIPYESHTMLQSSSLYLQAAGSPGIDSTKGIHLRWMLRGALGELHLPKGNLAEPNQTFNRSEDYVKIYRAKYSKVSFTLNLNRERPAVIDHANRLWIYRKEETREIYLYFRNAAKYDSLISNMSADINHSNFIALYHPELLEFECKDDLFFKASLGSSESSQTSNSTIQLETLSVPENNLNSNKILSWRKTYQSSEINNISPVCENGKSIRFKCFDCDIDFIEFEFYHDFLQRTNNNSNDGWRLLGDYSLSLDTPEVIERLEPTSGSVNGSWHQYDEAATVNINNYKNKWDGPVTSEDRNIQQLVEKFIYLSNNSSNPTGIENVAIDATESLDISLLNLLVLASHDFHIARMLGLGKLDIEQTVFSDSYVYIAEYYTEGDLQDGQGEREAHHLFMSLPTSLEDQRLPIPLDIKEIKSGVSYGYDGETFSLTDDDGYSYDGKTRYISIFSEEETNTLYNPPFYISYNEFFAHSFTYPVYTGLRHRLNSESQWRKPELSNDEEYQYLKSNGSIGENETIPLLPPENGKPLYVHNQTESGVYHYNPYGINWFSRVKPSERVVSITTNIQPKNNLLPPSNLKPVLVQPEEPLLFTSAEDQELLNSITLSDKTLVRLSFNFDTKQDLISYTVDDDSITNADYEQDPELVFSDSDEVFADKVEVFFRENVPLKISGKATSVQNHPSDPFLALINTGPYDIGSSGGPLEQIVPSLDNGDETRFVGGVINIGNQNYIIQQVNNSGNWPQFSVYKKLIGDQLTAIVPSDDIDPANLEMPVLSSDGLFMATENMQDEMNWASANPMNFEIQIGNNWNVHREILELTNEAGDTRRILEKSRGIWSEENQGHNLVEKFFEEEAILDSNGEPQYDTNNNLVTQTVHKGLYKITFHGVNLAHHPQFNTNVNQPKVDWYKGIVRLFTEEALQGSTPTLKRKVLDVITIENIGTTNDLVVYAQDTTFNDDSDYDEVATGNNLTANFYPGYKAHLYSDQAVSLNETNTLPDEENSKYTIFGLRVTESNYNYESNIGAPGLMLAQKIVLPQQPEPPEGSLYATRPDYFGRATYTFTTKYNHQPHGVLFYRTSEESLLHALYSRETIAEIRTALENLGGNDEDYLTNRWQNFFDFNTLITDGDYSVYPPAGVSDDGYKFPNPDKAALFDWANHVLSELGQPLISANPGTLPVGDPVLIEFVKGAIFNAFVPLTEVPILYQYIPNSSYQPIDKKQVIKDRNGNAISPTNPDFEMAPMMKVIGTNPHETQFTDFKLDGTSNNIYFYGAREMGSQMKLGPFSTFLGPIKLVNSKAPNSPEIKSVKPILENEITGVSSAIEIKINSYPKVEKIKKINLYRGTDRSQSQSIRSMKLVNTVELEEGSGSSWQIKDNFDDLDEVPYSTALYYRITVEREVEYADSTNNIITAFAPSKPSKLVASLVVENSLPSAPQLKYYSTPPIAQEIQDIVLYWDKTCYNGIYHLYKMNNQGNWVKIHHLQSNSETIFLNLIDTDLATDSLLIENADGESIYHHFKVIVENNTGMLSREENILTVHQIENWTDIADYNE